MDDAEKHLACRQLAACVARVRDVHPGTGPDDEFYWYAREAAVAIARSMCIPTPAVIDAMLSVHPWDPDVPALSEAFWTCVCHPLMLCAEVMES